MRKRDDYFISKAAKKNFCGLENDRIEEYRPEFPYKEFETLRVTRA